ncbi:MAG: twin-arginine translocase TatA/TatE family subunit [Chloroflexota bacterium]|nr:twin-arginine translocase TatA/TatE family subunit [Chloroflexota bacterium]
MPDIGVPELLIVAFIVILLFGPSKAADFGGSLGKSIREFRKASREEVDSDAPSHPSLGAATTHDAAGTGATAMPAGTAGTCTACGTRLQEGQRFCTGCGAPVAATV